MRFILRKGNFKSILGISLLSIGIISSVVFAANTPNFTIKINPGTLALDIVNPSDYSSVATPAFNIGGNDIFASTSSSIASGVLGDDVNGSIYVSNPDATNAWTASIASNSPSWTTGGATPSVFSYNSDVSEDGQLSIDPSMGDIISGVSGVAIDQEVTLGTSSTFSSTVSSITLAQASSSAPRMSDFLISDIGLSQTIPALTPAGDYAIEMTLSVISNDYVDAVYDGSSAPVLLSTFNAYDEHYSEAAIAADDFSSPIIDDAYISIRNTNVNSADDSLNPAKKIDATYDESTSSSNVSAFAADHMFFKFFSNDPNATIRLYSDNPLATEATSLGSDVGSIIIPNYCIYNYPVFGGDYSNCNLNFSGALQTHPIIYILLENANGQSLYVLNSQQG